MTTLDTFIDGDMDYVGKLNANFQALLSAYNGLASQMNGTVQAQLTAPTAFEALFGTANALVDTTSFVASTGGTNLMLTSGYAWLAAVKALVARYEDTTLAFVGKPAGTYYVHIGVDAVPYVDLDSTGAFYSVVWNGSGLSGLVRIAPIVWGSGTATSSQISTALGTSFVSLEERLEAGEALAVNGDKAFDAYFGKLTKSVAGGTNVTLTQTEAGNSYFEFTGALTADINISFPLAYVPRIINVKNSTTGNFTINCKGSAGTGKTVAQGYSTLLHHDGTNLEFALDDPSTIAKVVDFSPTLTLDWSKYDVAYVVLTGDCTITHAGGRPGQKCLLYLEQDTTGGHAVTWANTRFGTDVGGVALSSAGDTVDEVAFSFNWVKNLYNAVSVSRGYPTV